MNKLIKIHDKDVHVTLTKSAERAATLLAAPLLAEIHLIFGCMIVKRVWFKERTNPESEAIAGNLHACFCTVRYSKQCRISHIDSGVEEPNDFPLMVEKKAFVPHWLRIDYKKGKWIGEYGYDRNISKNIHPTGYLK